MPDGDVALLLPSHPSAAALFSFNLCSTTGALYPLGYFKTLRHELCFSNLSPNRTLFFVGLSCEQSSRECKLSAFLAFSRHAQRLFLFFFPLSQPAKNFFCPILKV
uniref:Uncharacterized protein n=1 Tax=Caenorhabditis japonica TaxID=281687 RepID=A0A2Q4SM96_CAEJA